MRRVPADICDAICYLIQVCSLMLSFDNNSLKMVLAVAACIVYLAEFRFLLVSQGSFFGL